MSAPQGKAQSKDFRIEKEEEGRSFDLKIFKRLWKYMLPYSGLFYVSLIMLIGATILQLYIPYVTRNAIDLFMMKESAYSVSQVSKEGYSLLAENLWAINDANGTFHLVKTDSGFNLADEQFSYPLTSQQTETLRRNDIDGLNIAVVVLLVLLLSSFFCNYIQVYFSNKMGQKVIYDIRRGLFAHILQLPLKFFDHNPTGRTVTRVTNDTENLNEFFTTAITSILKDILLIVGIIFFMFYMSKQLTAYSMLILPVIVVATWLFRFFDRKAYRKVRTRLARINAFLAEHLSGMSVIQLFNRESAKQKEFHEINQGYYRATLQQLTVFAVFRPTMDILFYIALSVVIWFGAKDFISGIMTFGTLYAFINYIDMFFQPLKDISEKFDIVQNAFSSAEKIFKLSDESEGLEVAKESGKKDVGNGSIQFDKVFFGYDKDNDVLKDLSFSIHAGEKIAIVGETGAGKTSVIGILTALYKIREGIIKVDDATIDAYDVHELRKQIAVVLQEVFIFSGNIIDNIRLFDESISKEQVIEAAQYVHVDELIKKFENGFETLLNERASTLSAGERQLIALARAVVRNPKILILDEATANIDPVTEGLIQDALEKVSLNRTVIIIAHRLSTIRNANRILVFHKGKLAEVGTHEELFSKNGIYTQLYRLQYELK